MFSQPRDGYQSRRALRSSTARSPRSPSPRPQKSPTPNSSTPRRPPASVSSTISDLSDRVCREWLSELWTTMGLDSEATAVREQSVQKLFSDMAVNMRIEEEKHLQDLYDVIEKRDKERHQLAKELGVPPANYDPATVGLVRLKQILRDEVANLQAEKKKRIDEVKQLREIDEQICRSMELEPYYVSIKTVPTQAQLDGLKEHIQDMKKWKRERATTFSEMKLRIIELLEHLGEEPHTRLETIIVCEEDDTFVLSAANLEEAEKYLKKLEAKEEANKRKAEELRTKIFNLLRKLNVDNGEEQMQIEHTLSGHSPAELKELQTKLDQLEVLKCEKMEEFIKATRIELTNLWDLCYYSQHQRDRFSPFYSIEYTEEILKQHEAEVEKLQNYYNLHIDMFKKVAQRQDLWEKRLELRAKQQDPNHLKNARAPDLFREEKDRNRVNKLLPKVNQELRDAMAAFYEKHGKPFLVGGVPYEDFVEHQEEEDRIQQELMKQAKQDEKKKRNFHETIYGSKPITPGKRTPATLKRKAMGTPANDSKRLRPDMTRGSSTNKSVYGSRARRALGENNSSHLVAGHGRAQHFEHTLDSVTSDNFAKDLHSRALTSTFQATPESAKKKPSRPLTASRYSRLGGTSTPRSPSKTPLFKTPSSRLGTPGYKSGKKLALRSGRNIPFLI